VVTEAPPATDEPAVTEAPAATDEPAATEATAATDEPAATAEAPQAAGDVSLTAQEVSPPIAGAEGIDAVEVASTPAATIANTEGYYQLETMFLESENDCFNGNQIAEGATLGGAAFMDDCSEDEGEKWKVVPADGGYYHLQTQLSEGEKICLEGNQFVEGAFLNGAAFMDDCQDVAGQLWRFVQSEVAGYYRLQTQFLEGENKCLEGNRVAPESVLEGAAFLDNCLNVTGQLWKLVPPHWGYEGEVGPEHWARLDDKYVLCGTGRLQSPINLPGEPAPTLADVTFDYQESAVHISNNGHTIQVDYDSGSRIEIDGRSYELRQFHFHAPSEHAVADMHYPIEMHLVHRNRPIILWRWLASSLRKGPKTRRLRPFGLICQQ
jgi:hypothetical protein